jgi:hypothetical protein
VGGFGDVEGTVADGVLVVGHAGRVERYKGQVMCR